MANNLKFLSSDEAKAFDKELMSPKHGFSLDQLVELAALSCASSICYGYPPEKYKNILIIAGPGNNGCDGIVCGRHLVQFGYNVTLYIPKKKSSTFMDNIILQCENLNIPFLKSMPDNLSEYHAIVDAMFGFSFTGPIRSPYDEIIEILKKTTTPLISIDIPSGWDVDQGDTAGNGLKPDALISLTSPKKCAKQFEGRYHFLGGRFVPPSLAEKYDLNLPSYEKSNQFVVLTEKP